FSFLAINYVGIGIIFLKYTDKEVLMDNPVAIMPPIPGI
ncbi:MAG: hypothetical protein RL284_320, partial [Bacteroidota bacterium]